MHTSQTMAQSWFTPLLPLLEKTDAKLLEPSTFTKPEDLKIKSFFLASFAIASAAPLPSQLSELFPFLLANDFANPLNMEEKCPIALTKSPQHTTIKLWFFLFVSLYIDSKSGRWKWKIIRISDTFMGKHFTGSYERKTSLFFFPEFLSWEPNTKLRHNKLSYNVTEVKDVIRLRKSRISEFNR